MTTTVNATLAGSRPFFTLTPLGALVGNLGAGAKNLFSGSTNPDAVIAALFANNEVGAWYDPSDLSTMFQDSAGTTPVTADGQPVGKILDKSGNNNHASQSTAAKRPLLQNDGTNNYLAFDGVDDELRTANINFSTTDKVSAFSGYLCSSTNGGIITSYLAAPGFAVMHNNGIVRGDLKDTAKVSIASSVSNKHVTSTVFDSAQSTALEQVKQRVDGVSGGSVVAAGPAVGNQGTYAISVGNWLAALPMNGRIYSAIMLGRLATAQEITDTEAWVNSKTGAF